MRSAIFAAALLLAANVTNADAPPVASQVKVGAATRKLHFDWDDVHGASYYRVMYSVGSGAYRPAIEKVPAATSRATLAVPVYLASRPSLRYTVAACDTAGCGKSNGISAHFKPVREPVLICGFGAVFAVGDGDGGRIDGSSVDSVERVCMEKVTARFFARRRFR
jgi:hypothetical protein